ncbi:MAG: transporter substrate-binding domain-containing protein [Vicinamibacterales bacterium]
MRLVVLFVLALLAVWAPDVGSQPNRLLRTAFIADNPVHGRVDASTGAITGIAADVAKALGARWQRPYEVVPLPNAGAVIDALTGGSIEVGFLAFESGRAEHVAFSEPYVVSGSSFLVRTESTLQRSADVDRPGVRVAAVKGQSQQVWVSAHVAHATVQILPVAPTPDALAQLVLSGTVEAFAGNRERLTAAMNTARGVRILADSFMFAQQSLAVAARNRGQLAEINEFLQDLRRSGALAGIVARAAVAGVEVAPADQ